jgi:tetratricopeptide (TPR) repeat protein
MRLTASLTVLLAVALVGAQPKTDPLATEKKELVRLETAYKAAKAKSTKNPKDVAARNAYSKAASDYGTAVMKAMSLKDRAAKYGKALNLFREALRANPDNTEAKANKDMIESIYKSLGKPIPK